MIWNRNILEVFKTGDTPMFYFLIFGLVIYIIAECLLLSKKSNWLKKIVLVAPLRKHEFIMTNVIFMIMSFLGGVFLTAIIGGIAIGLSKLSWMLTLKIIWWISTIVFSGCVLYFLKSGLYKLLVKRNQKLYSVKKEED